jgi:hypothetical protein
MISHLDPRLWRDGQDWKKPARMIVNLLEKPDPTAENAGLIANRDLGELGIDGTDTLFGCLQLARHVLEFIELRHGESWAKAIFAECAGVKPTLRQKADISNGALLDRYERMTPKPTKAAFIRQVAKENEQLPKALRRGAGSDNVIALDRHFRDLLRKRRKITPRRF